MEELDSSPTQLIRPLSVRSVLGLAELRRGEPQLLSGAEDVDRPVRWVHIADTERVGQLLEGGELVLSTGRTFRGSPEAATRFLDDLEKAEVAGAVIELVDDTGAPAAHAAAVLTEAAVGRALPVALLSRPVRFVKITEVVHRMLIGEQLDRVERARHLHEVFTALSLEGASEQRLVDQAATLIGAPVVLEDVAHRVLGFNTVGTNPQEVLRDWTDRSRRVGYREQTGRRGDAEDWLQTPVGTSGRRWGRLVVPVRRQNAPSQLRGPGPDAETAQVLERAGQALTITRMASRDQAELLHQAQAGLLHELRQPAGLTEAEAKTRAIALGLELDAFYIPLVLRLDRTPDGSPTGLQLRERALLEDLERAVQSARRTLLAAGLHSGSLGVLLTSPARQLEDTLLARILGQLEDTENGHGWTAGVAGSRPSLLEAAAGLDEAAHVADTAATLHHRHRRFYRHADVRLRGLLALMGADPRLRTFAESELGPLLAPNQREDLELMERFLEHGGNKSALARDSHLSRPALYARLARIQEKLGVSLEDAESRTALHVALLWHRLRQSQAMSKSL